MSLAKLRLTPHYTKLAALQASEDGGLCLEGVSDADVKTVKQICQHMDLTMELKDGKVVITKPGHEFFEAMDVAAPDAKDKGGLSDYVVRGDLVGAEKLAKRGVVSQSNLFTALLALPQSAKIEEGCSLLEAVVATAEWPSTAARQFFEERARQATILFLGEAAERIREANSKDAEALQRSGRCQLDVMLTDGRVKGEVMVGSSSQYSTGRGKDEAAPPQHFGRGLQAGDCAAIRPMDGGHMTECEVVVAQPLILRPLSAPPPGTTGSGRPFRVDGLANRQQFSRTLTAVHLCAVPAGPAGNCAKDRGKQCGLPGRHRPSDDVLAILFGQVRRAARVREAKLGRGALQGLNASQQEAVSEAASACFTLVQGPPGTGKTTVAVSILKAWASSPGGGILCASDSNIAVDNIVEGLVHAGVSVVRVGRPEAARPELLEHTAEEIACRRLNLPSQKEASFDAGARNRIKQAVQTVIGEAQVVCCTAIGAGSAILNEHSFARVLIDEAAQATELASLVPICRGGKQVVMCGDQCQLPPTVAVEDARGRGLEVSLFERLVTGAFEPLILLSAQHRMHPAISAFSRAAFYAGRLSDGIGPEDRPAPKGFAWPHSAMPICFVHVRGAEHREGESYRNEAEADRVLRVVEDLIQGGLEPHQLGIVTPYAAQVRLLRTVLARAGLPTTRERGGIETNSVDGYQGREKEAIVISTVRSSAAGGLGFVADWRRANVAFTRARRGLVVVGDAGTLGREPTTWAPWLRWVRRTGCFSPPGSLDGLPAPLPEARAVGLSAALPGADAEALLEASATAWAAGRGYAPEEAVRPSGPEAKRRRLEEEDEGGHSAAKSLKDDKRAKKKEKKREKKRKKREKKLLKKAKKQKASTTSSTSSSS